MNRSLWDIVEGEGALVATAIHNGHEVRSEVAQLSALDDRQRLREEDPYTGLWTSVAPTRIVGRTSRFQVDLNRPREKAVYRRPEDVWGLQPWKREPSEDFLSRSLQEYDEFYSTVHRIFSSLRDRHGRFVVFDLHSYNHRRNGPEGPAADARENPEVNVGTGTMRRERWAPLVDRFIKDLSRFDFLGRQLDVRENVKFRGGHFPRWIHETFPESGCAIAIEFKKFFMDEWSGELDFERCEAIRQALESTVRGVREELDRMGPLS